MADETEPHAPSADPVLGADAPVGAPNAGRGPLASAIARAQAGGLLGALRSGVHGAAQGQPSLGAPTAAPADRLGRPGPAGTSTGGAPASPAQPVGSGTSRSPQRVDPHASPASSVVSALQRSASTPPGGRDGSGSQAPASAEGAGRTARTVGAAAVRQPVQGRAPDLRAVPAPRNDDILPSLPRKLFRLPLRLRP
jgi:hypothetical protein